MPLLPPVPVTMGCRRSEIISVDGFRVVDAWFPPGARLERHTHDRACFGVMISGGFDLEFAVGAFACTRGTVFAEPLGERHANRMSNAGAHVVVIQPDPEREALLRPVAVVLDRISQFKHEAILQLAERLAFEVRSPDDVTPLAVESLALEVLTTAARAFQTPSSHHGVPPHWLRTAKDFLHDQFLSRIHVADVGRAVNVHPAHLSRAFRRHFGTGVAAYIRSLRLEWAADRLRTTEDSLPTIAIRAGFADQSHLTRTFARYFGTTPARYRTTFRR